MVALQAGELRSMVDVRPKRRAGGNTELLTALQGLEKNMSQAAAESESGPPASCCWGLRFGQGD